MKHFHKKIGQYILFLMLVWTGHQATIQAQEINWSTSYPKVTTPEPLTVLGDTVFFDLQFTPLNADVSSAGIKVKLPAYIQYTNVENIDTGAGAGIQFTSSASGTVATGQTVSISITSNGNTLLRNTRVTLRIKAQAVCGANNVTDPTFSTQVLSGAVTVTGGSKDYQTSAQIPTITLVSGTPNVTYSSQTEVKTLTAGLSATNGEASSMKLIFKTALHVTLDHFKIGGTAVTHTLTSTSTEKTHTLTLTTSELGGKLGTTAKTITFEGSSTRCADNSIVTSVQYSAASACATYPGVTMTMVFPTVGGLPNMEHQSTTYVNASDVAISNLAVNMDGVTPTTLKTVYKNVGTADAYDILLEARPYGQYAYLDTANVYYQVEGESKEKVPAGIITVTASVGAGSISYGYYPAHATKPKNIRIAVDKIIPIGKTITVWVPTINGNIYDNGSRNVYYDYWTTTINGFVTNITSVKNRCMEAGPAVTVSNRIAYLGAPHFRQLPVAQSYKGGSTHSEIILVSGASTTSTRLQVYVKLPSWLQLDGSNPIRLTQGRDGTSPYSPANTLTSHGGGVYSIDYNGFNNNYLFLHFNFKADPCGASVNLQDTVAYWFNQIFTTDTLKNISQVFQPVSFECLQEGVQLDVFGPVRTTKGLKDSNNDSDPDDGSIAPDDEIRHDIYMLKDEGYFHWKGTIVGSDTYKHLYIPFTSVGFTYTASGGNIVLTGSYEIDVKRGGSTSTYSLDYVNIDNYNGYFHYNAGANSLISGDEITVRAPFRVNAASNNYNSAQTQFFVSINPVGSPMDSESDPDRYGKDRSAAPMGTYTTDQLHHWNNDARMQTFANNTLQTIGVGYSDVFHTTKLGRPYFSNEVRRHLYPYRMIWEMPEGYLIENPLSLDNSNQLDAHSRTTKTINKASGSTVSRITFDVHELYDKTYDGSSAIDPAKWMLPDDYWRQNITASLRATRGAKLGNSSMKRSLIYKNPDTGEETTYSETMTFVYTGLATTLTLSNSELTAYGPTVVLPSAAVGNPTQIALQDVWLYVKGNVENIKFKNLETNVTGNGVGVGGRWYKVSGNMPVGENAERFELTFAYLGGTDCTGDTVFVYTAAGFDASWNPDISQELDLTDYDHVGAYKSFIIKSSPATVSGAIITSTTIINEGVAYTLNATMSSEASPGALKDPEITITIPAGQEYIPGTAKIEYPLGTEVMVHASLESALIATNSSLGTSRTITVSLAAALGNSSILMAGYLASDITANDQKAIFKADFKPGCNTELTGFRFSGVITGETSCSLVAGESGMTVISPMIYPDINSNYKFSVSPATTSGNYAFNELRTTDTLVVTIRKIVGTVNDMNVSDSLLITMPESVHINGAAVYAGSGTMSAASGSALVGNNTVTAGVRSINLSLPVANYNSATNKGVGDDVVYKIPIRYTADGQTLALTPVHSIHTAIISIAKFGSCPEAPAAIGSGTRNIALVTTNMNPYKATLGETENVTITSSGFSGSWYSDTIAGSLLVTNPVYTFVPSNIDTLYYSVSSEFGGSDYGRVPVWIYIYPVIEMRKDAVLIAEGIATPHNGLLANPVSILFGDTIEYTITAMNANTDAGGTVIIRDTLPAYLNYVGGSGSAGVALSSTGTPSHDVLTWSHSGVAPTDRRVVSFRATPAVGVCSSQPMFINRAWVTSTDTIHLPTNSTYHQGSCVGVTTFSAGFGGNIYNAAEQALDYRTSPRSGILVVPEEGYRFAGWSHEDYISLRGKTIPAQKGIMLYDTLTIYGNVNLQANFEAEEYLIRYHLNGGANAGNNPSAYTIETGTIMLEAPEKTSDVFVGWTGSNGEELQQQVIIPEGTTGELEFYANFLYSGRKDEMATDPDGDKILAVKNELYIRTSKPGSTVKIYSVDGSLQRQQIILHSGETKIRLPQGIYVVTLNNDIGKKIRID